MRGVWLGALLPALFVVDGLAAQGLPFHAETALTTAFEERGLRTFALYSPRERITSFVAPFVLLPFAPHERVTTKIVLPITHKEVEPADGGGRPVYSNVGLGDVGVGVKWAFLVRNRFAGTTRLALAVQASLPTGSTDATFVDGRVAPRPLQLGTGAVAVGAMLVGTVIRGRWGVSVDLGQTRHTSDSGYRFGALTRYDLAVGLRFPRRVETVRSSTLQLYLELNGSVRAADRSAGIPVEDSGGHVAFLSPGVQWVPLPQLLMEASVQIPVVQDLDGSQARFGLRPAAGVRFLFF